MSHRKPAMLWAFAAAFLAVAHGAEPKSEPKETVLGVAIDFTGDAVGPYGRGFLDFWRWSPEVRKKAESLSKVEVVADADSGKKVLRVRATGPLPFAQGAIPLLRFAPFYPPQADALRLRLKVVSGEVRAFVGGPTAYYANSDVFTRTVRVRADAPAKWTTVDISLNHPLLRNYRRSGFSTDAARISYNRWAQEPNGLYLATGTAGEFLLEGIEVVARGEGKPFPTFKPDEVRPVKTIADFEDGRIGDAFNLYMAEAEVEWFEQSWKREKPLRFTPATFQVADEPGRGKSLVCVGPIAEEVHCAGVRTAGSSDANALRVTLLQDAPEYRNTVVGMGRAEAIDFLVFVAPPGRPFPWESFAPSPELRKHKGPGFDYQLSYRLLRDRRDVDFAIYQTRRYLRPREWSTLVLPAADFVCVYGSGSLRDRYLADGPMTCGEVIAVAWLNPWCRIGNGRSSITLRFDELAFVNVPGDPARHRSFWQVGDPTGIRWIDSQVQRGRTRHMLLPGDPAPDD